MMSKGHGFRMSLPGFVMALKHGGGAWSRVSLTSLRLREEALALRMPHPCRHGPFL